ncbi:thiamine pyrophosphate-binding protein [Endozoicomonas sp. SM1973]|uniref:Thiamine pyrophosphate-binding protein n=1 Tax=Spartinivicinus marinus TaxID=2994442 RepID=A0A853IHN9_9GAMM|nr:thiamine pyrophosphate-binding protein [Spartinivicinus marinus]MCX4028637.1 thiamine pyrophosphate-binding protein [Spartinivicinus marinus]NYZ67096.1 thiamine pyrophosphate-binding protein [Spartinivicinus marinus]
MTDGTKSTNYLLNTIKQYDVSHVFMVPGGVVDPFLDEFSDQPNGINAVVAASETGAAYMADGYARASGKFGVCMGIGGPGTANMIGPLATAYTDQSPVLAITGEIPTLWNGRGGFQDASAAGLNDISLLRPVTAFAQQIPNSKLVPHYLQTAIRTMLGNKPQPVSLSLPKDIQTETINDEQNLAASLQNEIKQPSFIDLTGANQLLTGLTQHATGNIAILAGSGCTRSEASEALYQFASHYQIPVATTLKAKGVFPEDDPLSLGVFGYAGTNHSTRALLNHDPADANCPNQGVDNITLLIVMGSSLNQRDTMRWDQHLSPKAGIYHVDVDSTIFSKNFPINYAVNADAKTLLTWLLDPNQAKQLETLKQGNKNRQQWLATIKEYPRYYQAEDMQNNATPLHPARVIAELQKAAPRNTVIVGDSGAHRAFAGHYWNSCLPRSYLTATALAPMGWAIPAGVGAKIACPEKPCVVITGDGCMLMNGIEIQTAAHHNIHLIVLVINNSALGNVFLRAKSPIAKKITTLSTHDWAAFSRSLGGGGIRVENPDQLAKAFEQAFKATGPFVIDARCDPHYETPINPWRQEMIEHTSWVDG